MLDSLTSPLNRRQGIVALLALLGVSAPIAEAAAGKRRNRRRPCPDGQTRCGKKCVDLDSDPKRCGFCGNRCAAGSLCCGGACVDGTENERNCGACGNVCPSLTECRAGTCLGQPQRPCAADAECLQADGLVCGEVTGCPETRRQCCAPEDAACSGDCDCCGTNTCQSGRCASPVDPAICHWSQTFTVPCPGLATECCTVDYPHCCPGLHTCCPKGYPTCCPASANRPDNYCCPEGTACCSIGCCWTTDADAGVSAPAPVPGVPGLDRPARG